MILLPELLYRHAFGQPLLREPRLWATARGGLPMLGEDDDWSAAVNARLRVGGSRREIVLRKGSRLLPAALKRAVRRTTERYTRASLSSGTLRLALDWMPASRYQPYWPSMRFFALPSFYDGRIRINLAGRERDGKIPLSDYTTVCNEVEDMVGACRDSRTGEAVVDHIDRCEGRDPMTLGPSGCDLVVVWRGAAVGFDHPAHGRVGPVPFRRTGGHTGRFRMAYVSGAGISPGDFGVRSSFDVVPTIVDLLGKTLPPGLSGRSLLAQRSCTLNAR